MNNCVLSDKQILTELNTGNIIITPFTAKNLGNCSYDVTLGENYYSSNYTPNFFYNPWNQEHVNSYWGQSKKAKQVVDEDESHQLGVELGSKVIILQPNELILGHTEQFIGGVKNITSMMKTRSSLGRSGLKFSSCAGWGDINYVNLWTFEIQNTLTVPVVLPVGKRVSQIVFLYTGDTDRPYIGKYQSSTNINKILEQWSPDQMLPKLYLDK